MLDFGEALQLLNPIPRSCLSTPLVNYRSLVGVLSLYSPTKDAFTEDHKRTAEAVARQVTQTVLNARQFEPDHASSFYDPVTGLPNVEHLRSLFADATSDDALADAPVSLLVVGIDNLRGINERFGRSAGDQTIRFVVEATRATLRGADVLFRHDGCELAVLLTQTDSSTSRAIARRVGLMPSQVEIDSEHLDVVIHVGVATAPEDGTSLSHLLDIARGRWKPARTLKKHTELVQTMLVR